MARLIELKQTAPERFLARFDTGEEVRTTLAVVTDFHLRSVRTLTKVFFRKLFVKSSPIF